MKNKHLIFLFTGLALNAVALGSLMKEPGIKKAEA